MQQRYPSREDIQCLIYQAKTARNHYEIEDCLDLIDDMRKVLERIMDEEDEIEIYGEYISFALNEETGELEECYEEDPILARIDKEMMRQIDITAKEVAESIDSMHKKRGDEMREILEKLVEQRME